MLHNPPVKRPHSGTRARLLQPCRLPGSTPAPRADTVPWPCAAPRRPRPPPREPALEPGKARWEWDCASHVQGPTTGAPRPPEVCVGAHTQGVDEHTEARTASSKQSGDGRAHGTGGPWGERCSWWAETGK